VTRTFAGGDGQLLDTRLPAGLSPLRLGEDGRLLFVRRRGIPCRIERLDLATGESSAWLELYPEHLAGVSEIWSPVLGADGAACAYTYYRKDLDLFLLEGLE
jgi:hypothetical protein